MVKGICFFVYHKEEHRRLSHILRHDGVLLTVVDGHIVGRTRHVPKKLQTPDDLVGDGTYSGRRRKAAMKPSSRGLSTDYNEEEKSKTLNYISQRNLTCLFAADR